jgi:hypothetical protein
MPATLALAAVEQSTYKITVTYKDEDGSGVVPNNATWTLTDGDGKVINARSDVVITVPGLTNDIWLQGADLACRSWQDETRILTMSIDYDSGASTGLPCKEQVSFVVKNLKAVEI